MTIATVIAHLKLVSVNYKDFYWNIELKEHYMDIHDVCVVFLQI